MTEIHRKGDGLRTEQSSDRGVLVIKAIGYVDLSTVDVLEKAIDEAVDASPRALVMDLSSLDFLGSAGLSLFARTHSRLVPPMHLAFIVNDIAARPLQITGLDKVLTVIDDVDAVHDAVEREIPT